MSLEAKAIVEAIESLRLEVRALAMQLEQPARLERIVDVKETRNDAHTLALQAAVRAEKA